MLVTSEGQQKGRGDEALSARADRYGVLGSRYLVIKVVACNLSGYFCTPLVFIKSRAIELGQHILRASVAPL